MRGRVILTIRPFSPSRANQRRLLMIRSCRSLVTGIASPLRCPNRMWTGGCDTRKFFKSVNYILVPKSFVFPSTSYTGVHHRRLATTVKRATRRIEIGWAIFNWPACCMAAGCSPGKEEEPQQGNRIKIIVFSFHVYSRN